MNSTNPMGPHQMGINQMGKTTTTNARRPEPVQVATAARVSLARWLATGRNNKQLTIEDIARVTKIPPRTLERLEAGNHEGLPAEVFVKGFVRNFARAVGLDEQEALLRYSACGVNAASVPTAAARALVESMAELAPMAAAKPAPTLLHQPRDVASVTGLAFTATARATSSLAAPTMLGALPSALPLVSATALGSSAGLSVPESVAAESSAVESSADVAVVEPVLAAGSAATIICDPIGFVASNDAVVGAVEIDVAKKKTRAPRKKKPTKRELLAAQASSVAAMTQVNAGADAVVLDAMVVDASGGIFHAVAVALAEVPLADSVEATAPNRIEVINIIDDLASIEVAMSRCSATAIDVISDSDVGSHDVWVPRMPALSIPWTRPSMTAPMLPLVPTLVIDDSDPESAERDLAGDRDDAKAPRRSLIPSILLENDDRGRQGGLTLAVIILLIAATLTLSYLMRRPGAGGDGMTQHPSTPTTFVG